MGEGVLDKNILQSRCMRPYLTLKLHQQMFYNNSRANGPNYAVTQLSLDSFNPPILLLWFHVHKSFSFGPHQAAV